MKCYDCKHRGEVAGSAHSSCRHPATASIHENSMLQLVGLMGRRSGVTSVPLSREAAALNVTAARRGIDAGWFIWPLNFDPVWLERCDGFEAKSSSSRDRGSEYGE